MDRHFFRAPRLFSRISLLFLASLLLSCENDILQPNEISVIDSADLVKYGEMIQPIFNNSCAGGGCHINRTTSGVNLSSYEQVMNSVGSQYGEFIIHPGKPTREDSPIIDKLFSDDPRFGEQMPRNSPGSLTEQELDLIVTWIDQGARNID